VGVEGWLPTSWNNEDRWRRPATGGSDEGGPRRELDCWIGVATVTGDFPEPVNFRANLRNGETERDNALDALRLRLLFLLLVALGGVRYPL
jgi:hypothetical protein